MNDIVNINIQNSNYEINAQCLYLLQQMASKHV